MERENIFNNKKLSKSKYCFSSMTKLVMKMSNVKMRPPMMLVKSGMLNVKTRPLKVYSRRWRSWSRATATTMIAPMMISWM